MNNSPAKDTQVVTTKEVKSISKEQPASETVQNSVHPKLLPAELQEIVSNWGALPGHVKDTIRMLVESAKKVSGLNDLGEI